MYVIKQVTYCVIIMNCCSLTNNKYTNSCNNEARPAGSPIKKKSAEGYIIAAACILRVQCI